MWQRKQSIFIALGLLASGLWLMFAGAWTTETTPEILSFVRNGIAGVLILYLIYIFLGYKDQSTQLKHIAYAQWLCLLAVALVILGQFLGDMTVKYFGGGMTPENYYTALAPVGIYMLLALAKRFVKADIDLIKSADRIR